MKASSQGSLRSHTQHFIELIGRIQFGRLESLHIADGHPVLEPLPRIIREIKFGSEDSTSAPTNRSNLVSKRQVQELLDLMREVENGVIDVLEIRHGLPFRVVIAESSADFGSA